jgi:hypothetical protein
VTGVSYLDRHRGDLRDLFAVLEEPWPGDDPALVSYMELHWLGGEHGPGASKRVFDEKTKDAAWPLLRTLGVVDRADPPRDQYDQVIVMGAAGIGLYRRLEVVKQSGIRAASLTILAGLRPHSGLARDGALGELLEPEGRFAAADGWAPPPLLVYKARLLADAGVDPLTAARIVTPSETDLARLILGKHWPGIQLESVTVDGVKDAVPNELGRRDIAVETYTAGGPIPLLRILNGAPVRRDVDGIPRPARPTSRSTIQEWASTLLGSEQNILIVVNQPHLARVRLDVLDELARAGHSGLSVDVAGAHALRDSVDLNLLLGEIPARANAERRITQVMSDRPGWGSGGATHFC